MKITIALNNNIARSTEYFLRRRYGSKACLEKLAKVAILDVAAEEAKKESVKLEAK